MCLESYWWVWDKNPDLSGSGFHAPFHIHAVPGIWKYRMGETPGRWVCPVLPHTCLRYRRSVWTHQEAWAGILQSRTGMGEGVALETLAHVCVHMCVGEDVCTHLHVCPHTYVNTSAHENTKRYTFNPHVRWSDLWTPSLFRKYIIIKKKPQFMIGDLNILWGAGHGFSRRSDKHCGHSSHINSRSNICL